MTEASEGLPRRFGDWQLLALVGRGGMASVYRARRVGAAPGEVEVALKVVDPARAAAEPHLARAVLREGELVSRLEHRNLVAVRQVGEVGGVPFVAMELVRGASLAQLLRLRAGPLSPSAVLDLGQQLCQALEYAHDMPDADGGGHLVHRDVKPGNVLLGVDGTVKLADFGIARATRPAGDLATKTLTGQVKGTVAYMAPEQLVTNPALDGRADLFALGAVLYEAATSERLFDMVEVVDVMVALRGDLAAAVAGRGVPDRLEEVVPGLGVLVAAMLSKDPADRPEDAGVVYGRLAGLVSGIERERHALRKAVRAAIRVGDGMEWALEVSGGTPAPAAPAGSEPPVSDLPTQFEAPAGAAPAPRVEPAARSEPAAPRGAVPAPRPPEPGPVPATAAPGAAPAPRRSGSLALWGALALVGLVGLVVWGAGRSGAPDSVGLGDRAAGADSVRAFTHRAHGLSIPAVRLPGGTFDMGSAAGVGDSDEHAPGGGTFSVTVSPFAMATEEVTNAQYAAFLTAEGNSCGGDECVDDTSEYLQLKESGGRWSPLPAFEDHPVVVVTWYGADAFARWVGGSLPTEAQWEYACRSGEQQTWSGTDTEGSLVRYANAGGDADGFDGLAPVGKLEPNGWGLYDLSGNAWEWTADWKADYPAGPVTDPTGAASGDDRVVRGGGFRNSADRARCGNRSWVQPVGLRDYLGFRVVLSPAPQR